MLRSGSEPTETRLSIQRTEATLRDGTIVLQQLRLNDAPLSLPNHINKMAWHSLQSDVEKAQQQTRV